MQYVPSIVIEALGTLNKNLSSREAAEIKLEERTEMTLIACVLGTAKVIRNVLDVVSQGY